MPADTNTNAKRLTNWVDGLPSAIIQKDDGDSLGKLSYWVDGLPYATVYPNSTAAYSMMPFFWGMG